MFVGGVIVVIVGFVVSVVAVSNVCCWGRRLRCFCLLFVVLVEGNGRYNMVVMVAVVVGVELLLMLLQRFGCVFIIGVVFVGGDADVAVCCFRLCIQQQS